MTPAEISSLFTTHFDAEPEAVAHAPGRVNLIGEHTDYNQGFVFPAAINFGTDIAAAKRSDRIIEIVAVDYDNQRCAFSLDAIEHRAEPGWLNYVKGVCLALLAKCPQLGGANLVVTGNVPQGAGLSSSASFEIAIIAALSKLYQLDIDGVQAALLGQQAENDFVGCSCGIMDQLISALGKQGKAMLLDCQDLSQRFIELPDDYAIMIVNSNVKRGLVDSEYNVRREQCEAAARKMGCNSLREATLVLLESHKAALSEDEYKRARHVITENDRTEAMFAALGQRDIARVSQLMGQSHDSMRDDFEITVPAIDTLVEIIQQEVGESGGARMTGGGFGGCVVALLPKNLLLGVTKQVEAKYYAQTGLKQTIYICTAEQGAFDQNC
ncbi:galactokinase [Alteromonas lipolytica]|uniref:Galactokinase n=1 Tax=Alteromonas lipolytica TaxID=1856405 RepID=A0A1E8FJP4_9ALTE|nr:galactokinase [Alteromonas lipolytica]OFI36161.1 galactokinase [Alteromonas lipolytica]GGF78275.1 galactokinase [Alteromonas lipolytica]